tara:strand:- start:30 stop:326 length:297 start_codon:yes stop_codon:yes gene_type:complete
MNSSPKSSDDWFDDVFGKDERSQIQQLIEYNVTSGIGFMDDHNDNDGLHCNDNDGLQNHLDDMDMQVVSSESRCLGITPKETTHYRLRANDRNWYSTK